MVSADDSETINCLIEFAAAHPELRCFDITTDTQKVHETHPPNGRLWTSEKYHRMVYFRNTLLAKARGLQPDRVFSLDSDVLLTDPTTISRLFSLTEQLDAVSPLMYMTFTDIRYPSVMSWITGNPPEAYRRSEYPLGTLFQSDIIMAAVMMSKQVYENTNYFWHPQGEDLGWSADAFAKGYRLYSASYIYCPHVMCEFMYEQYKIGGDPRSPIVASQ